MPYSLPDNIPDAIKDIPKGAQEIYVSAFNSAIEQYNGDEAKAAATAWAAVKNKYEKKDDKWVAKESMSDQDKRGLLHSALVSYYEIGEEASPKPSGIEIEEVFDDAVVYNIDGQSYRMGFEIGEAGKYVFSEPQKVVATKVYKPMESLQVIYSEIIQEAGKRNVTDKVSKTIDLCQNVLSSEDESKVESVIKEATTTLKWIKEQAAFKTEDGVKFPPEAYAYVGDKETPSEWKLRLWEDPQKKVTRKQLGAAAATLSPGGFRGQKVDIPAEDLAAVKRKIRAGYRSLDVPDEEMPRWVKEMETRELVLNYMPLTEAKFDKGRATVIVIKPGFNASEDRYYPAEMLKRDYKVFEGQKMYADHPTDEEDQARPERSIKDWVATLKDVTCDENGVVTGVAEIVEPWLMQKLASLRDKHMLSEMGISINAVGSATKAEVEGKETLVIEKLVSSRSVDFVTEPGAGGTVTMYESDRSRDIDLIEISGLKERRPDLVKSIEAAVRAEITKEVKKLMENEEKIKELEGQVETLTTENTTLKSSIEEAAKAKAKAEAQAAVKEAVDKAELPAAAKERLLKTFENAESAEGITEAIQSEVDYIAKLSEAGKVKNLGATTVDPEKEVKALRESLKRAHPKWTDAQIDLAVAGR